jgi:hypothetical protein
MSVQGLPANAFPAEVAFQAQWTPENSHLATGIFGDSSIIDIITAVFRDPFFFATLILKVVLKPFIGRVVVFSSNFPESQVEGAKTFWQKLWVDPTDNSTLQKLRLRYEAIPLRMTTPDQVTLSGTFYRARLAPDAEIPTIIVAQPNAALYKSGGSQTWLSLHDLKGSAYNLAVWDYRGTGESEKVPATCSNQLALDGDTVYQCVQQNFHISENNIRFYGRSLGGAVSAIVRANHPSHAPYVNAHSFNTLQDLIEHSDLADEIITKVHHRFNEVLPSWLAGFLECLITAWLLRKIVNWAISITGWDFNVPAALQTIGADAMVVHDLQDKFMQGGRVRVAPTNQELSVTTTCPCDLHHMCPEGTLLDENQQPAADRIIAHLLRV